MAKNMQPILKRCKALGISPAVMGVNKETRRNPKQGRRKQSEYAIQLNEKQKAKFIYGVLEKQFRHYYEVASNTEGVTCLLYTSLKQPASKTSVQKRSAPTIPAMWCALR